MKTVKHNFCPVFLLQFRKIYPFANIALVAWLFFSLQTYTFFHPYLPHKHLGCSTADVMFIPPTV